MQGLFQEQLSAPTYPKLPFRADDANFGRFLCARVIQEHSSIRMMLNFSLKVKGRLQVFDHGTPIVFDEEKALQIMKADAVTVYVDMHEGEAEATAWGCDLT